MPTPTLEIATETVSPLSPADRRRLKDLEIRVESGIMDFASALHEIRTYKNGILWKAEYNSFEEYAKARFFYQKQHAYRLAAAGAFVSKLDTQGSSARKPLRESQIRPIINKLPEEHHVRCWEKITEVNPPEKLTTELVATKVSEYQKTLPPDIRRREKNEKAAKPEKLAVEERARERSFEALRKLKLVTAALPRASEISKLLKELLKLIERKT